LIGPDGKPVAPAVYAGEGQGYVDEVRISLDPGIAQGQGPAGNALREGRHFVCNDIEHDPCTAPWRDQALAKGFRASAAFPLRVEGRVIGVLNLYAAEADFFDAEEIRLLEELAADASLGLEYIAKEERLEHIAFHDPLTGLPNLNLFLDRLRQTLARARHHRRFLAVLVLDIEGFRQTVGALGRHAGDRILAEAARYLASAVREGDTVARLDGDEFGVVLADVARLDDVVQVAGKLVHRFPRAVALGGDEVFLKVRAGVAVHPNDGDEAEALLKNARLALHHASAAESDHAIAFYAAGFDAAVQEQHRIERALHHAIERGELLLHYQPVVDVTTRRIVGLEALARWESAELGPVPPSTFIPVAEDTGLIAPFGEWVFKTACRQALEWRARGVSIGRIAVNVSVRELRRADFVERLRGILKELALDPAACPLALEITESDLMEEREASINTLERLRRLGLAIYVDDFGTGYSSLAYLMTLPVDALKLDQSFVRKLGSNSQAAAIVKAIVALADGLGLQVIAEGVETEAQRDALHALGCRHAQGYLFSRPVPPAKLASLLEVSRPL
jgi:diguanylate cyclase (GGDEF)-like protein